MRTFEKILCAVDFSENSVRALQWTEYLAHQFDSKVVLLHVMDPYPVTGAAPLDHLSDQEVIKSQFAEFTSGLKIPHERIVSTGDASYKILALGSDLDASVIVLGTRGLTGATHKLLGSTTENVVRRAEIPVLTIPPHAPALQPSEDERVLLPLESLEALPRGFLRIRKIVRDLNAPLGLLHVVQLKDPMFDSSFDANPFLVTTYETVEKKQHLMQVGRRMIPHAEAIDSIIQFGDPAMEILKEAQTGLYRFILMGAKKSTFLSRFLDSTVYRVMSQSTIPVITSRVA